MDLSDCRLWTAMVTPFLPEDPEKGIDHDRAGELVAYLAEHGTEAVVVGGTTGEKPTLFDEEELGSDEKLSLYATVLDAAGSNIPVVANVGTNATNHSVWFAREVVSRFGDQLAGVMAVVPYYNKPPQSGIIRHMQAVAREVFPLPVVLYTVKGRTVVGASVDTLTRVAESIPNEVYVKEADGDITKFAKLRATLDRVRPDAVILSGDDALTFPAMAACSCDGTISVASHVAGDDLYEMIYRTVKGDIEGACHIYHYLVPVMEAAFCAPSPAPIKYALDLTGFSVGGCRLPMMSLPDIDRLEGTNYCLTVHQALDRAGLL